MSVVELQNVSVTIDGKKIIRNFSWAVRQGQHWALIGPNGSGKTTLLRLINGYLWPTSGKVAVLGKHFGTYDLRELRKSIGFASSYMSEHIPEDLPALDVVLSGRFASIGLYDKPSKAQVERAKSLLKKVDCIALARTSYGALSQGEKQRIIIARSLISSPQLLTLDEPCSGLDLSSREELLKLLQKMGLMKRGPTIIFATHRIEEIMPAFTHALIIRDGQVASSGPKRSTLTSKNIGHAFSCTVNLMIHKGRYSLSVS